MTTLTSRSFQRISQYTLIKSLSLALLATSAVGLSGCSSYPKDTTAFEGYACCNMTYTRGNRIEDSGYRDNVLFLLGENPNVIRPGTPIKVVSYGINYALVKVAGKDMVLANDYSRNLPTDEYARRWIWKTNPAEKIAQASPKVQQAIREARLTLGMTPEEVAMSLGYPTATANTNLDVNKVPLWRYWFSPFDEIDVFWHQGKVSQVKGHPATIAKLMID